ncbi:MAG TPA: hypothetical protein VFY18_11275 [Candidatus Limnocylindrales bacterium]|nr:hypothetical protein [Candidatus Limnocylindrales bacterium]
MAKDAKDGKPDKPAGGTRREPSGGQHHAARAHGQAARVDNSLPSTREALLALHAEARGRRNAAPLGSPAFRAAVTDLERIEVRVAAVERAKNPRLG